MGILLESDKKQMSDLEVPFILKACIDALTKKGLDVPGTCLGVQVELTL